MKKTSGDVDIHAPIIISDAGIANTFGKLLPKAVSSIIGKCLKLYNVVLNTGWVKLGVKF